MRLVLLFNFLIMSSIGIAQDQESTDFPAAWEGIWIGELEIFRDTGKVQTLPMELHILSSDTSENYSWTIYYGADKVAGKRAYELKTIDAKVGHYLIDEKNSILIEGYWIGNKFIQWFVVNKSPILLTVEKFGQDELKWEIIAGNINTVSTTGGETINEEEIPIVKTYPVTNLQRAILKKQ